MVHVVESEEEFDAILLSAEDKLVVVDFFAEWCGPCKQIAPLYASLSQEYSNCIFLKVDVDSMQSIAKRYQISAMPTFMFFREGKMVHSFKGASPDQLQSSIRQWGGSSSISRSTTVQAPSFKHIPQASFIFADAGKLDMISEKFLALNSKAKEVALDSKEISCFNSMIATLKNSTQYHVSKFSEGEHKALVKAVVQWPASERFPALDVLRLLIMHPEGASYHASSGVFNKLVQFLKEEAPFANHLMELRFISNSFRFEALRKLAIYLFPQVLDALAVVSKHENKGVRTAVYTVLLNYAVAFAEDSQSTSEKQKCLPILLQGLTSEREEEGLLRIVVTLGTLAYKDQKIADELKTSSSALASLKPTDKQLQEAIGEVVALLGGKASGPAPATVPVNTGQVPPILPTGGSPGAMGSGVNTNLLAKMAANPDILAAAQNPAIMSKLQAVMTDPSKMTEYQNDPEFLNLMQKLMNLYTT